jgi:hypothetical protein
MKYKKPIEYGLLIFALTTIMWCTAFAWMIGKVDQDYKYKIKLHKQQYFFYSQVNNL